MEKEIKVTEEQLKLLKAAWTFFYEDEDCYAMVADALELPENEDTSNRVDEFNTFIMGVE